MLDTESMIENPFTLITNDYDSLTLRHHWKRVAPCKEQRLVTFCQLRTDKSQPFADKQRCMLNAERSPDGVLFNCSSILIVAISTSDTHLMLNKKLQAIWLF